MRLIISTLLVLIELSLSAQNIEKITGDVYIDLENGKMTQTLLISNVSNKSSEISFVLHKYLEIDALLLNGDPISFQKDSLRTHLLSNYYTLNNGRSLRQEDSLKFILSGSFHVMNDTSKQYSFRSDQDIIESYSVFRANGLSAWHPVLLEDTNIPVSELLKAKKIDYSVKLKCNGKNTILAGKGSPSKSDFHLLGVQNLPMIIAGDYEWNTIGNILFINLDSIQQRAVYEETNRVIAYFEGLTGIPFKADPVFIRTEMDFGLEKEFAFYSYPVTVYVNKRRHSEVSSNMMTSHELAHYYFGNVFVPKSNLYWFFSESVTEYFSLKYQLSKNNTSNLNEKYQTIKMLKRMSRNPFRKSINNYDVNFVRLEKIRYAGEVHEVQRYFYSPFQLIGMEHEIGEDNMMVFIKSVYPALTNFDDGYSTIINTLHNIGIDHKTIRHIEKKYFKHLSLKEYHFLESALLPPSS